MGPVVLIEGDRSGPLWPRPGRVFAGARTHTFADLAAATDDAFARWDRAHLHLFERSERRLLTSPEWDDVPDESQPSTGVRLSSLELGEQFLYTFDLGESTRIESQVRAMHSILPRGTVASSLPGGGRYHRCPGCSTRLTPGDDRFRRLKHATKRPMQGPLGALAGPITQFYDADSGSYLLPTGVASENQRRYRARGRPSWQSWSATQVTYFSGTNGKSEICCPAPRFLCVVEPLEPRS